jgi:acyl dehydratase
MNDKRTTKKPKLSNRRLSVRIVDGVLTIAVGMGVIVNAIRYNEDLVAHDDETHKYLHPEVTDAKLFGRELVRALQDEEEDGTTPIHLMLDAAVMSAIENGAEGIQTGDDKLDELQRARRLAAAEGTQS